MVFKFGENLLFPGGSFFRWTMYTGRTIQPRKEPTAITTIISKGKFMIIWSLNLQGSSGFIRQQILPTCTQKPKKSPFSAVSLNFPALPMHEEKPAIRGFWRPSRWDGNWSCLAHTFRFWDEGVLRGPSDIFFGAGRWRPKRIGKDWKIFGFWNLEIIIFRFQNAFFGLWDCLHETGNKCVCLLAILKSLSTGFAIKVFQIQ